MFVLVNFCIEWQKVGFLIALLPVFNWRPSPLFLWHLGWIFVIFLRHIFSNEQQVGEVRGEFEQWQYLCNKFGITDYFFSVYILFSLRWPVIFFF